MSNKRIINGVGVVKHDSYDKITNKRKLGLWCKFYNSDQTAVATDNLNFTLENEKYQELKDILGLDEFSSKTPIRLTLSIAEDKLEEWAELAGIEDEGQAAVDED